MADKSKKKLTAKDLKKKRIPLILIPGILAALALGWKTGIFEKAINYYEMKQLFPNSGVVSQVEDGDTLTLNDGVRVRLIGIDAPDRGAKKYTEAKDELSRQVLNKKVYLEYDRYQDDKFGRVLAWVWVDCETTPQFLPADYMHKSGNESNPGLTQNPKGCNKGKLVNAELVKSGYAKIVTYKGRGKLKYEDMIKNFK